ncbi:hypothetical protein [Achromobacter insuavis]|uniref:Uncharacterized protein n=1 Tax=Achromobacter insuavis AXX-A TaxID=1003200 RepID=F7T287_9BURK|nr:hypothetical protein [Achromobacter insuavis]EGP45538.1 hypothetical protein AXXA_15247 [Achromobacter insuavis AXX-A]
MDINQANASFAAMLRTRDKALISAIQRLLRERPFTLDPGVAPETVDAIHFEYDWESFAPVAIPLNTRSGYCGRGLPLALPSPLIPPDVDAALTDAMDDEDDDFCDELREKMTETYIAWFQAAWHDARAANRDVRGFLSVHDTLWRTDLDTGEEFREDAGRVKFF